MTDKTKEKGDAAAAPTKEAGGDGYTSAPWRSGTRHQCSACSFNSADRETIEKHVLHRH